jgi:hypothetical protein
MQPKLNDHQDGNGLLNKIPSGMYSDIDTVHKQHFTSLVQWHMFGLNKCLSSEYNVIRGRTYMPWNLLVDIPIGKTTIDLMSLIRTLTSGRLSTEEDDNCRSCELKPVSHHSAH